VLRFELLNPMADLRAQLEHKHYELQEANRMKSQFLANMSHELRTPLNSIIGYTQLVVNGTYGALNDTQRDRLEKVIRNGHNLLTLINDVIDLNRIETGRFTLERGPVDTYALLTSVADTIAPMAAPKGLRITRDFDEVPPIYADEQRTRQIITNIVANAVKFTHEGGVTVRARAENGMVRFEISDTGIGIAPEQYEMVFVEFEQLDNSPTREYEGSGLGMAITKRLVEKHGGRIWLESAPGQGTTFYVTLPISTVDPQRRRTDVSADPVIAR
jgi:signal transduction histidine kinase